MGEAKSVFSDNMWAFLFMGLLRFEWVNHRA